VTLDAHNDLLEALSVDTDYEGFLVSVTSPGEFPLTYQNGFKGTVNAAFYLRNFEQILDMIFSIWLLCKWFFITV
jgi:hypothetical protein